MTFLHGGLGRYHSMAVWATIFITVRTQAIPLLNMHLEGNDTVLRQITTFTLPTRRKPDTDEAAATCWIWQQL